MSAVRTTEANAACLVRSATAKASADPISDLEISTTLGFFSIFASTHTLLCMFDVVDGTPVTTGPVRLAVEAPARPGQQHAELGQVGARQLADTPKIPS